MGTFDSVCWLTGCPIGRGDRVAALLVEAAGDERGRGPHSLYSPRGVFGRGVYDESGWLHPDPDQPEFEGLLKALLDLPPDTESHEIYDATAGLHQRTYRKNGRDAERGVIRVVLVRESALDRAVQVFLAHGRGEEIPKLYAAYLEADRAADKIIDEIMDEPETISSPKERRDMMDAVYKAGEQLSKALLPFDNYPALSLEAMLLAHSPLAPGAIEREDALKDERWLEKILEVGAFYEYHRLYLWRPVCQPSYALDADRDFLDERLWLAEEAKAALAKSAADREFKISCRVQTADGKLTIEIDAWDWLNDQGGVETRLQDRAALESELESRYRRLIADPEDLGAVRELLHSDWSVTSDDWQFARQYGERFGVDVSGRFDVEDLKTYVCLFHGSLAQELGLRMDMLEPSVE